MLCNENNRILMKKAIMVIFTIVTALSISVFGTVTASAETKHVTGQEMTFDIGDGKERTGTYTGPLENDLPHGRGRFEWKTSEGNHCVYEGDFAGGILQGQGTMTIQAKNGDWIYTGDFSNGSPQGQLERVGGNGILSLIRNGGMLGFALWLVIALMIFLVMFMVTGITELIRRYLRYRAARSAGTVTPGTSFWKMSGAAIAELSDAPKTTPCEIGAPPLIIGKKSYFTQIMGLITIIIALDVWWAIAYGIHYFFWIFLASTIWQVMDTVTDLRRSIRVENRFVTINGTAVFYEDIMTVSLPNKGRIIIKTIGGKRYKLSIINAHAVRDAIILNTANHK
jgi:hypothetical protein